MTNPLLQLGDAGQAVWLDFIERKILENGDFTRLIGEDGLKGVTSNPSIFEKAIGESEDYDASIARARARATTPTRARCSTSWRSPISRRRATSCVRSSTVSAAPTAMPASKFRRTWPWTPKPAS